jgi:hypothetical protein
MQLSEKIASSAKREGARRLHMHGNVMCMQPTGSVALAQWLRLSGLTRGVLTRGCCLWWSRPPSHQKAFRRCASRAPQAQCVTPCCCPVGDAPRWQQRHLYERVTMHTIQQGQLDVIDRLTWRRYVHSVPANSQTEHVRSHAFVQQGR